ncbi:MAG: polyprenyl synthetase family protein [Acidimicrobiia bacterium]|nr:polyprenyl synthetase family protein [Acidimicrobiia bacterium]
MKQHEGSESQLSTYMEESRSLVTAEIERLFGPNEERTSGLYELILDYPLREGKALRPTLAIATCRALGGYLEAVLPTSATLELYHNAFLIHDDIEDDSLMRRGRPTLHLEHGVPIAVNVGDAMLVLSLEPLLENIEVVGLGPALKILEAVARMSRHSVEGQAIELEWVRENRWDLSDDDYRRMVVEKTGWYSFITPTQIGAIVAGATPQQVAQLEEFATELSVAFQITDDLLNLHADVERYGKEIGGDLWEGKRTVMLLHAIRTASAQDAERARSILAKPRPTGVRRDPRLDETLDELLKAGDLTSGGQAAIDSLRTTAKTSDDVEWLLDLLIRQQSAVYAARMARKHAELADIALRSLDWIPRNRHRDILEDLIAFVHERTR